MIKIEFSTQNQRDLYTAYVIAELAIRYNEGDLWGWLSEASRIPHDALPQHMRPLTDFNWWSHAVVDPPQRIGNQGYATSAALETRGAAAEEGSWGHATLQQPLANGIMETVNRWGSL